MQNFAVNTYAYTFSHSIDECIESYAGTGAQGLEVMMYPGHAWPDDMDAGARRGLAQKSRDAGLPLISLNMPNIDINIAAATADMRTYSIATLSRIIAFAGDLEVPGVVIGPGKHNPLMPAPREELLGHFHRAMDSLVPAAQAAGTRLLVENMPFAFLPGAEELMAALTAYTTDDVGVVYDIANGHFHGEDLAQGFRAVAPRLALVHVSDTPRSVYLHAPVGQGSVPFADSAKACRAVGYDGPVMLEIICDDPEREIPASAAALSELGWR